MSKSSKTITAKEQMLKKIRQALLQKKDHPFPQFEESALYESNASALDLLFAEHLLENGGQFIYCEDEIQAIENLLLLSEKHGLRKIYAWEPKVQQLLNNFEFPYFYSETGFEDASVGITSCESLIARWGSILISNGESGSRKLSVYPPIHIVFAYTSQLVLDIDEGLHKIQQKYGLSQPSMVSLISGPSRTADIEKTLVMGAHGPQELFVFLLEDRID